MEIDRNMIVAKLMDGGMTEEVAVKFFQELHDKYAEAYEKQAKASTQERGYEAGLKKALNLFIEILCP